MNRRRPPAVVALLAVLSLELATVAGYAGFLVVELLVATPASLASAVALTVLVALAAVWLAAIVVGVWRGSSWIRGAGVVWHVLQFAVGIGALQGAFAQPAAGWPLAIAAVVGVVLLLSRPVAEWTRRD